jgi:hypothetical protein
MHLPRTEPTLADSQALIRAVELDTCRFRRAVFTVGAQCAAPGRQNAGQIAAGPRVVPL